MVYYLYVKINGMEMIVWSQSSKLYVVLCARTVIRYFYMSLSLSQRALDITKNHSILVLPEFVILVKRFWRSVDIFLWTCVLYSSQEYID